MLVEKIESKKWWAWAKKEKKKRKGSEHLEQENKGLKWARKPNIQKKKEKKNPKKEKETLQLRWPISPAANLLFSSMLTTIIIEPTATIKNTIIRSSSSLPLQAPTTTIDNHFPIANIWN